MSSSRVTAVIKARNEEGEIGDAVASAFLIASEVLVVDDQSEDATWAVARQAGARVVEGPPHGGQIDLLDRYGFGLVDSGWILRMDADERITQDLAREFRGAMSRAGVHGVRFARLHYMFGGPVRHGGWFKAQQVGFFRADSWDRSWAATMHSQVPVRGQVLTIDPRVAYSVHYDYDNVSQFIARSLWRYARADAESLFNSGVRAKRRDLIFRPGRRLLGRYVVRQGFRDGRRGLVLAALLAAYDICVSAHIWQLEEENARTLA